MMKIHTRHLILVFVLAIHLLTIANAATPTTTRNAYIPNTISIPAQHALTALYKQKIYQWVPPSPNDLAGWRKEHAAFELNAKAGNSQAVRDNQVSVTSIELGGVKALDIRPNDWQDNHKVVVYLHGGGYTMFSVHSTLTLAAPMSRATGMRVISVDYTTAPIADWQKIQEQVISVFKALRADGYAMSDIALYGDSAGGGLAINTTLNLRDRNMGMPAAVVLLSPWADLTDRGDTMHTLAMDDPILTYDPMLKNMALAYAHGLKLNDPRISPLYADFSKGFPPTLIVEGTKCIFLSTNVRLFQALEAAKQEVKLDIYEGMWHDFLSPPTPEADLATKKEALFIKKHLLLG